MIGAVCPQEGEGWALVLPFGNTAAMNLLLFEISGMVSVPANITLLPLPPKCPELNATEQIWQSICDNWLSNRLFRNQD